MKAFEVFLVFALTGVCVSAEFEDGMKVKFAIGGNPSDGNDFFLHIPLTISAAVDANWEQIESPESYHSSLVLYCKEDCSLGLYYDEGTGFITGLKICINQNEFTDSIYDWNIQGYTKMTVPTKEGKSIEYQCTELYFASKDYLNKPVKERKASITSNRILKEKKIFTKGFHGKMDELPTNCSELKNSLWTKQGCLPWMGQHHYYNMSADTPCEADKLYQWFPLCDDEFSGGMVGIGHIAFGKMLENKWGELPAKAAVKAIVPNGPQCLYGLADNPGLATVHIYFVNDPWRIGCKLFG